MSDRAIRWLACVMVVAGASHALSAQGSLVDVDRRRRDAAYESWHAQMRVDSLADARGRTRSADTARAGDVTLISDIEVADTVRLALAKMDSVLRRSTIGREPGFRETYRLVRDWSKVRVNDTAKVTWWLEREARTPPKEHLENWLGVPTALDLGEKLAKNRRDFQVHALPAAFSAWLGSTFVDSSLKMWAGTYVAMATSPTLVARRCLLGDLAGCREALRLEPVQDPVAKWLTAGTRREIVRSMMPQVRAANTEPYLSTPRDSAYDSAFRCVDSGDDASCIRYLHVHAPGDAVSEPLANGFGREEFVITALEMPRAPGFRAVFDKPSLTPVSTIEAISGTTADSVMGRWRARVMAAEPERVVLAAPRVLSALAWTFGLGLLALRGTRWR